MRTDPAVQSTKRPLLMGGVRLRATLEECSPPAGHTSISRRWPPSTRQVGPKEGVGGCYGQGIFTPNLGGGGWGVRTLEQDGGQAPAATWSAIPEHKLTLKTGIPIPAPSTATFCFIL